MEEVKRLTLTLGMVEQKVREIIEKELSAEMGSVTMDSNLMIDLGADSLDVLSIVTETEDAFGISLPRNMEAFEEKPIVRTLVDATWSVLGEKADEDSDC